MTVPRAVEKVSKKQAFVLLRYTLIIAVGYLVLVEHGFSSTPNGLILLIVAAVISNVVLMPLPARITDSTTFTGSIVAADTVWITAVLMYGGLFSADFFYLYFFVLILAAIGENLFLIAVGTIGVVTAYFYVLSDTGTPLSVWSAASLPRLPFLLTAAVCCGYLVDRVRCEQRRAHEEADTVARLEEVQQELAEQTRVLQSVLDSMGEGVVVADENGKFLVFNLAAEQMLGTGAMDISPNDWSKTYGAFFSHTLTPVPTDDLPLVRAMRGEKVDNVEIFLRNPQVPEGTLFSVTGRPLKNEKGDQKGGVVVFHDITERKRAEEALRETRHYLERLIEGSTDAIISTNEEGNVVLFNKGAEILLGYGRDEIIGQRVTVVYESEERAKEVMRQMRQNGGTHAGLETSFRTKDGTLIPVLISASVLFDADGQEAGTVAFSKDLRDRKKAEQALQAAKDYAENLIDSSLDMIISSDLHRNIVEFNRAAEQNFGYRKAEVLGKPVDMLYGDPFDGARVSTSLLNYERFLGEVTNRKKNGEVFCAYLSASLIRDAKGEAVGGMGISRDITERKRAEEVLRWLEKAVETMDLGVTITDTEGTIVYTNPAEARMHGHTVEELIAKNAKIFAPRDLWKPMAQDQMNEKESWTRETTNLRKDGSIFPVHLMSGAILDAGGETIGIVTLCEDITERKQVDEELKATQLQLIQSAKFESVGQLAAGVAHEVKNPLHILLQGLVYLSQASMNPDDDNVALVLEKMNNAVKRADRVIKGLLDFSVPSAIELKHSELNAVVEESLLLVNHELVKAHITLVKEFGGSLPPLKLDRQKIEQVFVNLFINAIHAMPAGGTLTVKTYAERPAEFGPDVGRRRTDQFQIGETLVVAEVLDTGTGIPTEKLDRLFDPFFTTKPPGQGTGLGLSVTRKILELHEGIIEISNRQEGGVRVTLTFKTERSHEDAKETDPAD